MRDRKAREFSNLVHGAMTGEEHVAKFVELSRFAPYLILDESKKVKKFREGLNDRIRPLIIDYGVDTFTEAMKRAMSLEEDFRYNPNSKESEKKQGPFNSQHGKGQGHKKGFFKNSGNRGQSSRHARVSILSLVIRRLALVVVNFMMDKIVMGSRFALLVSNPDTLLEIA